VSAPDAIRDRLRDQPLPGETEAAARTWPVVEAALAAHTPSARRSRMPVRVVVVLALLCAGLATALSPAGAWIGDRFQDEPAGTTPAFAALPQGGSVLAISPSGAYAVRPDGGTRELGAFSDAGWSPHGLHVVGVEGRRLVAVEPAGGTVKWTLTAKHAVHRPAWSTADGFAVAYLEGRALKVVAGNGDPTTNRVLRRDTAPVTPAWRPHSDRVLTYATAAGALVTLDTVTGDVISRSPATAPLQPPISIAWSPNGRTLVALWSHSVSILDRAGHVRDTIELPRVARELAVHPSGKRAAVVAGRGAEGGVIEVRLAGGGGRAMRELFQGSVDGIAWSPDGRRLLLGWRGADEWLLLGPRERIRAMHAVSGELSAAGGFPRVAGWCCAR
jgi:hypothetical protein